MNEVSSRRPIGPRACSFCVELPISAPIPNSKPSVKRVEALTYTHAASTPAVNSSPGLLEEVTIASEWPLPWALMCSIASAKESTTPTASFRSWYSVSQSASVASPTSIGPAAARVRSSPTSSTPASRSSASAAGRNSPATSELTSSVSAALQTPGR